MNKTGTIRNCLVLSLILLAFVAAIEGSNKTCPKNEYYTSCGDSCQTECATLNQPCLIRHFRCPDGCYCNKGYARNNKGVCIPIAKCPKH
ncbi:venom serine protease inhibitor [Musca autumnalis]|uniref:venom serine protease inhibitor n=1 Tax=Musca autumnalis TaxID=221902 RepID=UPI003CFA5576